MPAEVLDRAMRNAKTRGFGTSFSAYVAWLLERDAQGGVSREDVKGGSVEL